MSVQPALQHSVSDALRVDRFVPGLQPPPALQQVANRYPQGDGSFAASVAGTRPQPDLDLALAMMANDVYAADNPQTEQALAEAGWQRLQPSADGASLVDAQGNEIPLDPALLSTAEGFDAAIYQNAEGQYVVAFRGTDDWGLARGGDADDNGLQGLGFETGQYRDAVILAETAQRVFGDGNVAFTGHSLGGGLASAASLATGVPGVTFNAAGLSDRTLESLGFNPNAVRESAADSGQLRRYIVNGDPLNAAQQDLPLLPVLGMSPPNAVGHELRIDPPAGVGRFDLGALHGGGGDGASYVEALRQNSAYEPAERPLLHDALERYGEYNLNQLGSLLRQGEEVASDVAGHGSELVDGLQRAGEDFLRGDVVDATAQAVGDVLDFGIDSAGSLLDGAIDFAGDTSRNLANAGGGLLRDIGDATGLEAPFDAVAGVVEGTGQVVGDIADTVGDVVETVADVVGDGVEAVVDVAGDVGQALSDGAQWLGEKLNPVNWF